MAGMAGSINNFTPIHDDNDGSEASHVGEIDVFMTNFFGLYGITNTLNLSMNFPYKYWKQFDVKHEDAHHRNENQTGFGD
ncbi:MAG: hypothetical protein IIB95_06485, partial [Candidatus Marinimicrobia bacterium]|nr:hypothetical protein [Candidatus Neomarinimicrobiota bacterium]